MITINVLLSGRLRLDGYGHGYQAASDGTYPVSLGKGSTVRHAIDGLAIPAGQVIMSMVNGRRCPMNTPLEGGDRVVLIPADVAAMWAALHRQAMGLGIGSDR